MDGTIEILYDEIQNGAVEKLIYLLLGRGTPKRIEHSEIGTIDSTSLKHYLLKMNTETIRDCFTIILNMNFLKLGLVVISQPLIRLIHFKNSNEVEISFDKEDLNSISENTLDALEKEIKRISLIMGNAKYYCGYEPAKDIKTSFFSWEGRNTLNKI
jgi:hypothetical protein